MVEIGSSLLYWFDLQSYLSVQKRVCRYFNFAVVSSVVRTLLNQGCLRLHSYLMLHELGLVVVGAIVLRTSKDFVIILKYIVSAKLIRGRTSLHSRVILVVTAVRVTEITVNTIATPFWIAVDACRCIRLVFHCGASPKKECNSRKAFEFKFHFNLLWSVKINV